MDSLHVATLNVRNLVDRWDERLPRILADRAALQLDYIWVRGRVRVDRCGRAFDRPAVGDPTLHPSDHFGLFARLSVGR